MMGGYISRRAIRPFLPVAASLLFFAGVTGCGQYSTLGPGELVSDRFRLTVTVTNVGTGFGTAEVTFPAGTKQSACTTVLGPGESCSPYVERPFATETADIQVSAEPGSRFIGWVGAHCEGTNGECTVRSDARDPDIEIAVEARFDLAEGS